MFDNFHSAPHYPPFTASYAEEGEPKTILGTDNPLNSAYLDSWRHSIDTSTNLLEQLAPFCKWKIFLAESMFEQPAPDYRVFPHFGVRNSLEAQTEQCAARLRRGKSISMGWTFNLRLR